MQTNSPIKLIDDMGTSTNIHNLRLIGQHKINVSLFKNLTSLMVSSYGSDRNTQLKQSEIKDLNLRGLIIPGQTAINDVSFMTNLRYLDISRGCGVDQDGIKGLNLVRFTSGGNKKIKFVHYMSRLRDANVDKRTKMDKQFKFEYVNKSSIMCNHSINYYVCLPMIN